MWHRIEHNRTICSMNNKGTSTRRHGATYYSGSHASVLDSALLPHMRRGPQTLELPRRVLSLRQERGDDGAASELAPVHRVAGGHGAGHVSVLDDDLAEPRRRRLPRFRGPRDHDVPQLRPGSRWGVSGTTGEPIKQSAMSSGKPVDRQATRALRKYWTPAHQRRFSRDLGSRALHVAMCDCPRVQPSGPHQRQRPGHQGRTLLIR